MGKNKFAKTKRNNLKKNKLVKKGLTKPTKTSKKAKLLKKPPHIPKIENKNNVEEEEESDHGEDMLGMVEQDDLNFLKQAVVNNSYSLLKKVRFGNTTEERTKKKSKKRKLEKEEIEDKFDNLQEEDNIITKNLLPIKSQTGIIRRTGVEEKVESDDINEEQEQEELSAEEDASDEEDFTYTQEELDLQKPLSAAKLFAAREEALRLRKIHIGTLSSGLLENPEEKVTNLRTLLQIMEEGQVEVYVTVRKLVTVSLLEIFKDILPNYQLQQHEKSDVKLKKDTLKLQKYETMLLLYYKKYLQKLEKMAMVIVKKMGDNRVRSEADLKLAELAIHCLCDLLITHPYFNFAENIAQTIMPFLNHKLLSVRQKVNTACKTIFKEDKKGEITLKILRIINQYLRNHAHNVNVEMLDVLLALNIKDVNLDEEKEQEIKQKKLNAHKSRILQLSKKEKKRKKKLQEVEKELLETKAQENQEKKQKNMTEITKVVFGIYFRILKSSSNTKILGSVLEGLAKFAHVINLEYYSDLVAVLNNLLKEDWLGYKEQLNCIQTVLIMLSGQGEVINMDPSKFYTTLYSNLLTTNCGKNHSNFLTVLQTLTQALIKRRKSVTHHRLIGFTKRLATLSLQLLHNGSLGSLSIIKSIMQVNKFTDVLLDLDTSVGDGKFFPELEDPEYCNASNSALYELALLHRHYHPIVSKMAKHIAVGVPATGEGSLPPEIGKCSAEELFEDFDPSEVAFKPSIPVPKKCKPKSRPKVFQFADPTFKSYCKEISRKKLRRDESGLFFAV